MSKFVEEQKELALKWIMDPHGWIEFERCKDKFYPHAGSTPLYVKVGLLSQDLLFGKIKLPDGIVRYDQWQRDYELPHDALAIIKKTPATDALLAKLAQR